MISSGFTVQEGILPITIAGKYTLLRKLRTGGMAEVYLARLEGPEKFEKLVVIKRILPWLAEKPRFVRKFLDEARIAADLRHANIVDIYEIGEDAGSYFIAMEFLHGQDLRRVSRAAERSRQPMPLETAIRITVDAARGLHYAHTKRTAEGETRPIVHRDVSPHNIIVTYDGRTKLVDFGIAKAVIQQEASVSGGAIEGKIAYMSPEQAAGREMDPRSDQFSLGIVLYELTTGLRLFRRESDYATLRAVESARVPRPTKRFNDYPKELEGIVLRALAAEPVDRYESCEMFAQDLSAFADSIGLGMSNDKLAAYIQELFDEPTREKLLSAESWNLLHDEDPREGRTITGSARVADMSPRPIDPFEQSTGSITLSRESLAVGAPTGIVTLVFTDVEGSTLLWDAAPDAMRVALRLHNEILRQILRDQGGYEVKTEGDAFMVAFSSPVAALEWSRRVQEALLSAQWPEDLLRLAPARTEYGPDDEVIHRGLRLRMGVHTGAPDFRPDPRTTVMDYFGPDVNRAARICGAAHGGQIVFSAGTWDRLGHDLGELKEHMTFQDLGEHHLRGLSAPEKLHQANPNRVASRWFPPLRTTRSRKTNLPPSGSAFLGREKDLQSLNDLAKESRLISIVGPAGTGKTRLAIELGRACVGDFDGGVWICDLTEVSSVNGICNAVASVVGVPLMGGSSGAELSDRVARALASRGAVLMVLDNFEHVVVHGRETVGRWLADAPQATFVVTSREPLRIKLERRYELSPLPVPSEDAPTPDNPAIQLFVERARNIRHDFELGNDLEVVGEIVRSLDGIPLAIELAAARVNVLSPKRILARLDQRFRLLTRGETSASLRTSTLFGAIEWSWNLLEDWERAALAQCAVFKGGFSLEAAEAVLDLEEFTEAPWVLDVVQSLREKSLLRAVDSEVFPDEPRFSMYESIREFALERLADSPARFAAEQRHRDYFLGVAPEWLREASGKGMAEAHARIELELENLHVICERGRKHADDPATAGACLAALLASEPLVRIKRPARPFLEALEEIMAADGFDGVEENIKVRVLLARGEFRRQLGDMDGSRNDLDWALELAVEAGDKKNEVEAYCSIAMNGYNMGDAETNREYAEKAITAARELKSNRHLALAHNILGIALGSTGHFEKAIEQYEQAVKYARRAGTAPRAASSIMNIAINYNLLGRFEDALESYRKALSLAREIGHRHNECYILSNMGATHLNLGDVEAALQCYNEALEMARYMGLTAIVAECLCGLGEGLLLQAKPAEALECAAESLQVSASGGYKVHEGACLRLHGRLAQQGALADALHAPREYYEKSITLLAETGERNELAESKLALGEFLIASGDTSAGRKARWEALELFESLGMNWRVEKLREKGVS